eukprot:scaffold31967_cov78-Skeletonema_dohrnii-CCMP3373.AAC.2
MQMLIQVEGKRRAQQQRCKRDFTCVQPKQPNDPDTGESGSTEVRMPLTDQIVDLIQLDTNVP